MDFLATYLKDIVVILTFIGSAFAVMSAFNNRMRELHQSISSEMQRFKNEIHESNISSRAIAKSEKVIADSEQKSICNMHSNRIMMLEEQLIKLDSGNKLNLKCQDILLELNQDKGNGRVKKAREELKEYVIDNV